MHGIGWNVDEIACLHRIPSQEVFDRTVFRCIAHRIRVNLIVKSNAELCAGIGFKDQPAFLLALATMAIGLSLGIGWVDLHRKRLAGEDVFDQ